MRRRNLPKIEFLTRLGIWRLGRLGGVVSYLLLLTAGIYPRASAIAETGPAHVISWDSHSLLLDGNRLLVYSGEFHYWRLPSRADWQDRLEKMKAAGLNTVSIYFNWQYHSFAPGQYDFSGIRDIDYLLRLTERLGLFVIARVGPYMNGEVDAGGLPGWLLTKRLFPRSQTWDGATGHPQYSETYSTYAREWYDHLLPILARHQVTSGGSVLLLSIENEYNQIQGSEEYMRDLYGFARADGMKVPIFHNDYNFRGDWSKLVDLYAFDSYPYGFQCCHQWWDAHFQGMDTWEATVRHTLGITSPIFVSELQGGSFDPWHGAGYGRVAGTFGADWFTALDQTAFAQGATLVNTYMFAGGTTWGYMGEPGVYSSYDYGAPLSEAGALRPAFYAAHRLGMFLHSFGSILANADAATSPPQVTNPLVTVHARVDPATGQQFIFLRHGDAGAAAHTHLSLSVDGRSVTVPQLRGTDITVPGHGAELLTANVQVGPLHLRYSTSQVLTDSSTAQGHYLVVYGPAGSTGETDFAAPVGTVSVSHSTGVRVTRRDGDIRLNYQHDAKPGMVTVQTSAGTVHLLLLSSDAASRVWVLGDSLALGPDLVTDSADGWRIANQTARRVQVFGVKVGQALRIDGRDSALADSFMGSIDLGTLAGSQSVGLPELRNWKFAPEAPEVQPSFDDRSWLSAARTGTANPNVPTTSSLLADDYGFHYGFVWYRGHFTGTGQEQGITISARQSYSVYLNGQFLGGGDESLADPPHAYAAPITFAFPAGAVQPGKDNVVAVLTESLGHDEGWLAGPLAQSPQGLLSAQLLGADSTIAWRLQGNTGGESPPDMERGILNASGLFGERQRWYVPSFDDRAWQDVALPDNWQLRSVTAPVGWYRTHVTLSLAAGDQEPIGLYVPQVSDKAVIWVNGWLVGRYWEQMGPQHLFYIPDGLLHRNGDNVIAIAVWNRNHLGGILSLPSFRAFSGLAYHSLTQVDAPLTGDSGYWHTAGNRIVDANGRPIRIAAVNWSGMQNIYSVPAGLDKQPLSAITGRIRELGFNAIRLPFSNALIEENPVVTAHLDANPDLRGLHALDIMDRIVAAASKDGLRVILENHRSSAGTDPQDNGLWYTTVYPEAAWISDWQLLADRYRGNATVVGVDLRNEPHTGPPGPWSLKTYLHQGATWGPYRGKEQISTDWRLAAERGGDAVLGRNSHLLIFVEGIQQYPDRSQPGGLDSYWWGGVLQAAGRFPVRLSVDHQLVYSPHEYGPEKYGMPFFGDRLSYDHQVSVWSKHWGFLEAAGVARQTPIFIGEFGTCGSSPLCVSDTKTGSQGLWFDILLRYLRSHPEISWSFWALNGTNPAGEKQPNYILRSDWRSVRLHQLTDALRDIEVAPPPA